MGGRKDGDKDLECSVDFLSFPVGSGVGYEPPRLKERRFHGKDGRVWGRGTVDLRSISLTSFEPVGTLELSVSEMDPDG